MTKLQNIQEAFQNRIVTDEFDPNATYNIKERDLEWLFSHIKELENKYQTETELRATWERQALHYGYHLRKAQEIALDIQKQNNEYNNQIIESLLSEEHKVMFRKVLNFGYGWIYRQNQEGEIVVTIDGKDYILKNIELFQTWLEGEINSQKTDS